MVKDGYKQTELGLIPNDWDIKTLGDVLHIRHGKSQHEVIQDDGKYPILGTGGEIGKTNTPLYDKPSVLIGRKGTIDKPRYMDTPFWTVDTLFYSEVRSTVDAKFLFYKFNLIDWYSYNEASGVPSLNARTIENIIQSLPSKKEEQKTIASVLSDTDEFINSLQKLISKKEAIKTATMQQLLTPKENWKVKRLGDICSRITTGKLDANAMNINGDYRFYTCAKNFYYIDNYAFNDEALLVSGNGANVGYIHYYKGKFNAYQRTYVLIGFSENIQFIKLFMEINLAKRIRAEVNSGNTPYITMDTLTDMIVMLPRTKDEQITTATILLDMSDEIQALNAKLSKTKAIKDGMMQELLTGKIRLI